MRELFCSTQSSRSRRRCSVLAGEGLAREMRAFKIEHVDKQADKRTNSRTDEQACRDKLAGCEIERQARNSSPVLRAAQLCSGCVAARRYVRACVRAAQVQAAAAAAAKLAARWRHERTSQAPSDGPQPAAASDVLLLRQKHARRRRGHAQASRMSNASFRRAGNANEDAPRGATRFVFVFAFAFVFVGRLKSTQAST